MIIILSMVLGVKHHWCHVYVTLPIRRAFVYHTMCLEPGVLCCPC